MYVSQELQVMASQGVLAPLGERYLMREQKVFGSVVASDSLQPHLQDFCTDATDLRFAALVEHLERPHYEWKMEFAAVAAFVFLLGRAKASSD